MSASLDAFAVADPCGIFPLYVMVREHAAIIHNILLPKKKKKELLWRVLSTLFQYFAPMNDNVLAL